MDVLSTATPTLFHRSPESPAAPNSAGGVPLKSVDDLVVETLMVSLVMMDHEFSNGAAEAAFDERNQAIETHGFDRLHKPFRVGIRVGRLIRRGRCSFGPGRRSGVSFSIQSGQTDPADRQVRAEELPAARRDFIPQGLTP